MSRTPSRKSYSLKGQLGLLFAALGLPLLVLQGWWSYHDYRSAREQAWADALAFADAVDLGIGQFLDQSGELLRASAEESGLAWLEDGGCADEMSSLRNVLPFVNVLVAEADGPIVCAAADVPAGSSADDWSWLADFRRSGTFMVAPPAEADFVGTWILPMAAPIRRNGEVVGALIGAVPLTELSRLLGAFRPPEEQLTTIATGDGTVLARSADADRWVGQSIPAPTGSDRLVAPGRWVAEGPDLDGIPRTWGQVLTDSGWMVYVGVPDDVVFGPARAEALRHMGATLIIVLFGVLLAGRSYSRIARALRDLAEKTRLSGAGEVVLLPPETPREISDVIEQFNETLQGRSRAEAAQRTARERFQSIFDNAVFGLYVSTPDGRFLQVNPALVEMLGYPSEDALIEAGPEALYANPERRREVIEASIEAGEGRTETCEFEWLRADGTPIIVRVAGKMIAGPDGEPVYEMIVQDITDERRTEDELRQTQKMEAIGQLAGGVAHDFNNLLTVIAGNVELLEDDLADDDPLRDDLTQINKATKRAASLTRRLLTFSRSSRQGVQTLDVNEVVPELGKMLVPIIGENIALVTDLADEPLHVSIDPGELEQLVLNLVLNARDAIPDTGRIVIETRRDDRDGAAMREEGVALVVSDDGLGMDSATRPRIFEPFYTTKPMGEGTGLGLSTVYGIVKRAGGDIAVESELGVGTRMEIWLPRVRKETRVTPVAGPHDPVSGSESILVVEDDELVRNFVIRALREVGFDVHSASSGDAAMELLQTQAPHIDMVLTDVVMPGLSGPELAERLALVAPDTPVLFMSGYVDRSFLSAELDDHPDKLLRKPFTAVELKERVREVLDRTAGTTTTG